MSVPHVEYEDADEQTLLDLTVQIGVDANRVSSELWERLHEHFTAPQIVEACYVITQYIAISKFGDALGVELEPVFSGMARRNTWAAVTSAQPSRPRLGRSLTSTWRLVDIRRPLPQPASLKGSLPTRRRSQQ